MGRTSTTRDPELERPDTGSVDDRWLERYERQNRIIYPGRYPHAYDGRANDGFCDVPHCGKPAHDPIHVEKVVAK